MTISVILSGKGSAVISIAPQASLAEATRLLAEKRIGALPVMEGDTVAGVLSERDVIHALAAQGAAALDRSVGEVMTAPAITAAPDHDALAALSLMTRRRIRHLPVVEEGRVVGLVSIGDLVKFRIDRIEAEANAMREYIQAA